MTVLPGGCGIRRIDQTIRRIEDRSLTGALRIHAKDPRCEGRKVHGLRDACPIQIGAKLSLRVLMP
jgi:hypothetical protein